MKQSQEQAATAFVHWLSDQVENDARGTHFTTSDVDPAGRFWLGTLAPEEAVLDLGWGDRGERLDPCAIGLIYQPAGSGPWSLRVEVQMCGWRKDRGVWTKGHLISSTIDVEVSAEDYWTGSFGATSLADELAESIGLRGLQAEIRARLEYDDRGRPVTTLTLVNTSPKKLENLKDTNLYETALRIQDVAHTPFQLVDLPDSYRFDRSVPAYGVNCGVAVEGTSLVTTDTIGVDSPRRDYYAHETIEQELLSFSQLSTDPLPALQVLVEALEEWGRSAWAPSALDERAQQSGWGKDTRAAADAGAQEFHDECARVRTGLGLLMAHPDLMRSFRLMNEAISHSAAGRYSAWRPFQIGFLLANLSTLIDPDQEADVADIVWFATGGGKTETYLGLIVMAAFADRLRGKGTGISVWSRFPLRMLSLQQTQRFADALAGAELVRRREGIPGEPFSVGFFVGQGATPNRVPLDPKEDDFDYEDDDAPARFQILMHCPFCREPVAMHFDRLRWCLEHRCTSAHCPWPDQGLPFYIVDDDIYRYLPTVVVGTLDKAASISAQASMRGFVGAPRGRCSVSTHGYTYAPRADRKTGCLVPGCRGTREPLDMDEALFPPSFRLQDELHLLRDSLGAVDAHYESLLDSLQMSLAGTRPKILASSATLAGSQKQVDVLYRRQARVFPVQGPTADTGFWSNATAKLARRFIALAPRGATVEFAIDRLVTVLQASVRRLLPDADPEVVMSEAGIHPDHREFLLSVYGIDVVYGNTLRDLEAVARSLETQIPVSPLITRRLTGQTDFDEVRDTLARLDSPEPDFGERIHVVTASSMMSHGVDIDRLNVMIVIGVPLTTAEFIQATSRAGRTHPGLVFVMHKIARERDASVFRAFPKFISHGDRFIEPVPITRRSRRVLERTLPGIEMARILALYEPRSSQPLTLVGRLREFFQRNEIDAVTEVAEVARTLNLSGGYDELLSETIEDWCSLLFETLGDTAQGREFTSTAFPGHRPMRSLRDVEEQLTVRD